MPQSNKVLLTRWAITISNKSENHKNRDAVGSIKLHSLRHLALARKDFHEIVVVDRVVKSQALVPRQ